MTPYFYCIFVEHIKAFVTLNHYILGIDPGTLVMGFGIIQVHKDKISLVEMGVLHLAKYKDHAKRLHYIFEKVSALVQTYEPKAVALEAPFFGKNPQSMLKLGRAQGVAIAAAMAHGSPTIEYAPRKIKMAVAGSGNATKERVLLMLQSILKFDETPKYLDATDALAAAVCHHFQGKNVIPEIKTGIKQSKKTDWSSFIEDNQHRIRK